ncbi:flagellar protein FliT [Thiomicrospira microaerophila]|uniref:hypothetical protein n=1 Tax=Thiomicrospira microaerophila TaxID=406020 RepID=UPI00200DD729|nr:hypothetical protein [Thiomicrospira microaerophila]UQB42721.1 flagellar protein FliT [Thiomicrospira microaerophila]
MMSSDVDDKLLLLTDSQQMLIAAQQANWPQLVILEKQFEQRVKSYFQQPGLVVEENQALAKQLIDQQDCVQALIKQAQKEIQGLMNVEEHNVKAMHSYLAAEKSK